MNVCAFMCTDISFYPKEGTVVYVVPPKIDFPRKLTVKNFVITPQLNKIQFYEIQDKEKLIEFDNMHLLVENCVAQILKVPLRRKLISWKIFDETSGEEFVIKRIERMPTQLIAICEGSKKSEVQIVLHEDLIEKKDEEAKLLKLRLPKNYF